MPPKLAMCIITESGKVKYVKSLGDCDRFFPNYYKGKSSKFINNNKTLYSEVLKEECKIYTRKYYMQEVLGK